MIKRGITHVGVFFLYLVSLLPLPLLFFFARLLYYPIYYVIGYRKKVVRQNLHNSFPEKTEKEILAIEKKFFRYLSELMFEIIRLSSMSEKEILQRVTFNGIDQLENHFNNGESILGCTAHYCNWEWGAVAVNLHISAKTIGIYKPLSNKVFDAWFYKFRTKFGNVLIVMRHTLRGIAAYKNEPTLLSFASDQSPSRYEIKHFVNFLNQPTAALLGVEKIAKSTNRPVYYFKFSRPKKGYYHIDILPVCLNPASAKEFEITDLQFKILEDTIKENPQYWLWSHKRWKIKPES